MHKKEISSIETENQERPRIDYNQLTVGAVIVYLMRPEQLPTNPEREWRGKVVKVYSSAAKGGAVEVELLEAGHEGLTELVYAEQVIRIEVVHPQSSGEVTQLL